MKEQRVKIKNDIGDLAKMTIYDIWSKDLDDFEKLLSETYEQERKLQEKMDAKLKKGKQQAAMKRKKGKEGQVSLPEAFLKKLQGGGRRNSADKIKDPKGQKSKKAKGEGGDKKEKKEGEKEGDEKKEKKE